MISLKSHSKPIAELEIERISSTSNILFAT